MKEAVKLLEPLDEATKELCAENVFTLSMIIPMGRSLQLACRRSDSSLTLVKTLLSEMNKRFQNMDCNKLLAAASILDPRVKKVTLSSENALQCEIQLKSEISKFTVAATRTSVDNSVEVDQTQEGSALWKAFDDQVSAMSKHRTSSVDSTMEIHHYFQAGVLARKEDPA